MLSFSRALREKLNFIYRRLIILVNYLIHLRCKEALTNLLLNSFSSKYSFFHLLYKKVDPYTYCKILSSRPVYYSILDSFRSQYKSIKFFFISSLKIQKCATNRDSLLLATFLYLYKVTNLSYFLI